MGFYFFSMYIDNLVNFWKQKFILVIEEIPEFYMKKYQKIFLKVDMK